MAQEDYTRLGKLMPGDPAERFELDIVLDKGTSGQVWRAKDCDTGEDVAIKIIEKGYDDFEGVVQETELLSKMKSFYLTKYVGSWVTNKTMWLVMELADLGSMELVMQVYEYQAKFSEDELSIVCALTLLGLKYLHGQNIIHRDIKGKNILVNKYGDIKLADLGIAKRMSDPNGLETDIAGSPHWMAPEVASNMGYNTKADIWSLGITLIELADGEPPHKELDQMDVLEKIPEAPPPELKNPREWSTEMKEFLALCMEKDLEKRLPARDLLEHVWVKRSLEKTIRMESQALFNISQRIYDIIEDWRKDDFQQMLDPKNKEVFDPVVKTEFTYNSKQIFKEVRAVRLAKYELAVKEKKNLKKNKNDGKKKRRKKKKKKSMDDFASDDDEDDFTMSLGSTGRDDDDDEDDEFDDDAESMGTWDADEFSVALSSLGSAKRSIVRHVSVAPSESSVKETESLRERQRRRLAKEARLRDQLKKEQNMEFTSRRDLRGGLEGKLSGLKGGGRENAKAFGKRMKKKGKKKQG